MCDGRRRVGERDARRTGGCTGIAGCDGGERRRPAALLPRRSGCGYRCDGRGACGRTADCTGRTCRDVREMERPRRLLQRALEARARATAGVRRRRSRV